MVCLGIIRGGKSLGHNPLGHNPLHFLVQRIFGFTVCLVCHTVSALGRLLMTVIYGVASCAIK